MCAVYRYTLLAPIGLGYIADMSTPNDNRERTFEELQAATWEELVKWGIIIPAKNKFDLKLWESLLNPDRKSLLAEFLKEREEESF